MGKKLAIKGYPTRGNEVIELLKMMGGINEFNLSGKGENSIYYLRYYVDNVVADILYQTYPNTNDDDFKIFTLDEFYKKYPFKVGDKVMDDYVFGDPLTIKSMCWSVELKTVLYSFEESDVVLAAKDIKPANDNKLSGTVSNLTETKSYTINLNDGISIGNSIESTKFMQIGKTVTICFNTDNYEDEVELQLGDYEIEVRDGRTYAIKKKPKYPKLTNLSDCKEILGEKDMYQGVSGYKGELLTNFQRLIIYRDAYWKIAGEQMGLNTPWKHNYLKEANTIRYAIYNTGDEIVKLDGKLYRNYILCFPTEEMRDVFYENFKDLIEQCKELL